MKAGETWMNPANAENRNAGERTFGIIEPCWAVCDTGGGYGLQWATRMASRARSKTGPSRQAGAVKDRPEPDTRCGRSPTEPPRATNLNGQAGAVRRPPRARHTRCGRSPTEPPAGLWLVARARSKTAPSDTRAAAGLRPSQTHAVAGL